MGSALANPSPNWWSRWMTRRQVTPPPHAEAATEPPWMLTDLDLAAEAGKPAPTQPSRVERRSPTTTHRHREDGAAPDDQSEPDFSAPVGHSRA
jgi:hypothetical protein